MPTTIQINLLDPAVGATYYDVYVSDCVGGSPVLVADNYLNTDFPIFVDLVAVGIGDVSCYEYSISADTGCICIFC